MFVHNGKFIGIAFEDEELKTGNLYFTISMFYKDQSAEIVEPFQTDISIISNIVAKQRQMI